ncbi:MAG: hypothetical protein ACE5LC_01665 [Candidatus Aminicenantales bacterium]
MELWEAVYIARNLKAIYYPHPLSREEDVKFLKKKFRYRRLGVLEEDLQEIKTAHQVPFHPLKSDIIPSSLIFTDIPDKLQQLLPLSSFFMMPLLCSASLREEMVEFFLWSLQLERSLASSEFRFALRLLSYIPVDMASRDALEQRNAVESGQWNLYRKRRSDKIKEDAMKRFWRLKTESGSGPVRVGIIDPLQFLSGEAGEKDIPFLLPSGIIFIEEQ